MTPPDRRPATADFDGRWRRLSPWSVGTRVIKALPSLLPAVIGLVFLGRSAGPMVTAWVLLAAGAIIGLLPWLTTRYRITDTQMEIRKGLLRRETATVRRDRIRSVDVTADPLERVLRVRKVSIGTGVTGEKAQIVLDPIPHAAAEQLHVLLLHRGTVAPQPDGDRTDPGGSAPLPEVELARLRPSWIRFAPYSLTGFALVATAAGVGTRILGDAGLWHTTTETAVTGLRDALRFGPAALVAVLVIGLIVVATLISMAAYTLAFWGFRLVRRSDGALHTSRGLISSATATVERKRVRGVAVHEPILMRPAGGAKVHAIATGTRRHALLLPPAPRAVALAVADAVLERPGTVESALLPHGRMAIRRRYTRAALAGGVPALLALIAAALTSGSAREVAIAVAALALASIALGAVRAANLGSVRVDDAMVLGAPTVARTRTVIEFDGVIGVATRESLFQRRAGVVSLTLATAAGAFTATDLRPDRAAEMAAAIGPQWVCSFLVLGADQLVASLAPEALSSEGSE
jgi:putative membrane protein